MKTPQDILQFWFSDEAKARHFDSTPEFDAQVTREFEATATALAEGPLPNPEWERDAEGRLALIIALDQFPRNMYRGEKRAFLWDDLALAAAERMVDDGLDTHLSDERRAFVYMPFMHAEDLDAQNRCVKLTDGLGDGSTHRHAKAHRKVIRKFGRFPHRNEAMGRDTTPEERAFLDDGGYDPS